MYSINNNGGLLRYYTTVDPMWLHWGTLLMPWRHFVSTANVASAPKPLGIFFPEGGCSQGLCVHIFLNNLHRTLDRARPLTVGTKSQLAVFLNTDRTDSFHEFCDLWSTCSPLGLLVRVHGRLLCHVQSTSIIGSACHSLITLLLVVSSTTTATTTTIITTYTGELIVLYDDGSSLRLPTDLRDWAIRRLLCPA